MKFEEFLSAVVKKIGAKSAFDIARDARIKSIEKILLDKGITTEEELNNLQEEHLSKIANDIEKMPPIPKN
jgi:hypothetical protein